MVGGASYLSAQCVEFRFEGVGNGIGRGTVLDRH